MKIIYIKKPYITLGQFLKFINIIDNGSQAKYWLESNNVYINNIVENRRGRKIYENDEVFVTNERFSIMFSLEE